MDEGVFVTVSHEKWVKLCRYIGDNIAELKSLRWGSYTSRKWKGNEDR
jgi:hypothetical protein